MNLFKRVLFGEREREREILYNPVTCTAGSYNNGSMIILGNFYEAAWDDQSKNIMV